MRDDHRAAFEALVIDTESEIRAYIAGLGIPGHAVDDVAQQVYLELYRNFADKPEGLAVIAWCKRVARCRSLDYIRKWSRRNGLHEEALQEILDRTNTAIEEKGNWFGLRESLQFCLSRLSDRCRQLLRLRYWDDCAVEDIAKRTGCSSQAVRVQLFRIRVALRDCVLGREGELEP